MPEISGIVGGLIYLAIGIFAIIAGILVILTPFFILRIRNEVIQINHKMGNARSDEKKETNPAPSESERHTQR